MKKYLFVTLLLAVSLSACSTLSSTQPVDVPTQTLPTTPVQPTPTSLPTQVAIPTTVVTPTSVPTTQPTSLPTPTQPSSTSANGKMLIDQVNLRIGPGFGYDVVRLLPLDQSLTVKGRSTDGNWLEVRLPDGTGGWVFASYVEMSVSVASLPVTQASGGPDGSGSDGGVLYVPNVVMSISDNQATVNVAVFPKNSPVTVRLGLPGHSPDLTAATATTDASGNAIVTFTMPKTWSDGSALTQDHLLLTVSTADGKVSISADIVYLH